VTLVATRTEYLTEIADLFLEELANGQRGVYRRLGERMGVDWSTARSRVLTAVRRGHLLWTGSDNEPAAHRPGEDPWNPPGSFEHMFGVLERWVAAYGTAKVTKGTVVDGVRLGSWVQSVRNRYRRGTLTEERVRRLEGLPGWDWGAEI
jgi:hypothetical protein